MPKRWPSRSRQTRAPPREDHRQRRAADPATSLRIAVHVAPRARRAGVERLDDGTWRVRVTAAPREGQANDALIALLADHFGVAQRRVRIVQGVRARRKIVEIL